MKHLLITVFTLLAVQIVSLPANAALYYRFWQGWKLSQYSEDQFQQALNQIFVPATIQVGAGKSLLSYLPALPPRVVNRPPDLANVLPDEIALVVYTSKAEYTALRNTPQGKWYGDLHWKYFDKNRGSGSLETEPYAGQVMPGHAYDVLQSNSIWQKYFAVWSISRVAQNPSQVVSQTAFGYKTGLKSYAVLATNRYLIEFQLWESADSFRKALPALMNIHQNGAPLIAGSYGYARTVLPNNPKLSYGKAINVSFPVLNVRH